MKKRYGVIIGILAGMYIMLGIATIGLTSERGKELIEQVQEKRLVKSFVGQWNSGQGAYNEIYLNAHNEVILCDSDLKRIGYGRWSINKDTHTIQFSIQQINRFELIEPILEVRNYSFLSKNELVLTQTDNEPQSFIKGDRIGSSIEQILYDLEKRFDKTLMVQAEEEYIVDANISTDDETEEWTIPQYSYQNCKVGIKQAMEITKRVVDEPNRTFMFIGMEVTNGTIYYSISNSTESGHGYFQTTTDAQTGLVYRLGQTAENIKYQDSIIEEVLSEMPLSASEQCTIDTMKLRKIIESYKAILSSTEYPHYYISNVTMPFEIMCIGDKKYTVYQIECTSIEDTKISKWLFLEDAEEKLYVYKTGMKQPILLSDVKKAAALMENVVYGDTFIHQLLDVAERDSQYFIKMNSIGRDEYFNDYTGTYYIDTTNGDFYQLHEIENGEPK